MRSCRARRPFDEDEVGESSVAWMWSGPLRGPLGAVVEGVEGDVVDGTERSLCSLPNGTRSQVPFVP